jgi:hypothetical protein
MTSLSLPLECRSIKMSKQQATKPSSVTVSGQQQEKGKITEKSLE